MEIQKHSVAFCLFNKFALEQVKLAILSFFLAEYKRRKFSLRIFNQASDFCQAHVQHKSQRFLVHKVINYQFVHSIDF